MRLIQTIRDDALAGITVALVAVPQCMGFATIAGLPAVNGLYAAVVMGLVSAVISGSPRLVVGPAITASTMLLAVLRTVAPDQTERWPALAGFVAVLVGLMTLSAAALNVGRFIRFVSRSVIVGLVAGSAILTVGSQIAPALGLPPGGQPMLAGMLWGTMLQADRVQPVTLALAAGTFVVVVVGARLGPRFPAPFVALVASGVATWWLERQGVATGVQRIGELSWSWPAPQTLRPDGALQSDLLVGAAAIGLVGMIQNLAIAKALAQRRGSRLDARRELWALGLANVAAGLAHGLPGSGSFARSALSDLAGARTRFSGFVTAVATALLAAAAAPLARYISSAAIAGLLVATAVGMVDWGELSHILRRDRDERPVLATTLLGTFIVPIHWAILLGLMVSIAVFLRRVSRLHLFEMVRTDNGPFREQELDEHTGRSAITMLQVEGPLFFAHADDLADALRLVFSRGPRVTVLRMRRTQQIDFSVIAALERVVREYRQSGGHVVICGLTRELRRALLNSPLGELVGPDCLLETTREVFGSAHLAIGLAQGIVDVTPPLSRPRFRVAPPPRPR